MRAGPLSRRGDGGGLILLPALGDVRGEWVVGVWGTEKSLDGEEDGADLEGWGPVAFCRVSILVYGGVYAG
jgi:hypothetical protein